ncbi:MAG: integral rane sensor hybrid histidine kinase [Herminiimonas sp.]|nr:integral rane sensor hybrid histidine kinase [Herminiimonas sp.]
MAIAIVGPVVVFSASALNMLLDSERSAVQRSMHDTARATALIVDRELGSAEAALRVLASSAYLAAGDLARFYEQAKTADRGPGAWTLLLDHTGQQLINTHVPFDTRLPPAQAQARVQQVMQTRSTLVSDLLPGPVSKKLVTTVNVPVPLENGQRYVVASTFSADYLKRVIAQTNMPADWIVAVMDRQGRFIARSHNAETLVGKPAMPELVEAAARQSEGDIRQPTVEGIESHQVFTHSMISGWTIAVAAPVEAIESSARRATIVASLGLVAAIIIATGLAALFGSQLVSSINRASRSAEALGRGEMPEPGRSYVTEVDKLHVALNKASSILEDERDTLRQIEGEREILLAKEQEARRLAESQNQAKDQFLAMLGHEIRNPLAAISGAAAIMNAEGAGPERVGMARAILQRQIQNLVHIVDDLLDVARVTTGKIVLHAQQLDLAEVAQSCVDALHASGRTEHRQVVVRTLGAWVNADRTRLEQIINNLLGNALKYTPAGGRIDVEVYPEKESAVLVVNDSGTGISPDLLPRVFDLFAQGAATLDRAQGGLGIGLTLVRQLVTMHGGEVSASSDGPGKGSRFTVRLSLVSDPRVRAPDHVAQSAGGSRCVLLIEDNVDSREMMAMMLSMHGHRVLETGKGSDGLRLAAMEKPDVAIIDIGLPGMNGLEIARRLRVDDATREIGLIALTGYGQEADRQSALAAGFDMHLVKPVETERLLNSLGLCAGHQRHPSTRPERIGPEMGRQ